MRSTMLLIAGELKRLISYKLLTRTLFTSFIWVIVYLFMTKKDAADIAPLFMFIDVCLVSMLLIGASFYLEQQESTIKSMMVMPVSLWQILSSKVTASLVLGLVSVAITCIAIFLIHSISLNYALLLLFVILAASAHAAIGFSLALYGKNLGSMVLLVVSYVLIFVLPSLLLNMNIIDAGYEWILMVSPSHSANMLFTSAVSGSYEWEKALFAFIYLPVLAGVLLKCVVYPKFKSKAVRG